MRHLYHIFGKNVAMSKTRKKHKMEDPAKVHTVGSKDTMNNEEGDAYGVISWLGVPKTAVARIRTRFDLLDFVKAGIPKSSIVTLADRAGLSKKFLAEDVFQISVKTLERKSAKAKMDFRISSHAIEIARVLEHALEVFGNIERVQKWINRENHALNNKKPVTLFNTLTGLNMVNDVLGRIEEGVYT